MMDEKKSLIPVTSNFKPLLPYSRITYTTPGVTVREIVNGLYEDEHVRSLANVSVDGKEIDSDLWNLIVKDGQVVSVMLLPQGGDGALFGSDSLREILNVVLVFAGSAVTNFLGGPVGWFVGTTVSLVGPWIVNQIVPPSQIQDLSELGYSVQGAQNSLTPWTTIPKIYGRHKVFPVLGSRYYTESVGDDLYLRALFIIGYGPLLIEEVKIGDQNVIDPETGDSLFSDLEIEIRQGYEDDPDITLVTQDIGQESVGIELIYDAAEPAIYTTEENTEEISIDLEFPDGLCNEDDGDLNGWSVDFRISYRPVGFGEDSWLEVDESIAQVLNEIAVIQTIEGRIEYLEAVQLQLAEQVAVLEGISLPERIVTEEIQLTILEKISIWLNALNTMNDEGDATYAEEIANTITAVLNLDTVFGSFVAGPISSVLPAVLEAVDVVVLVVDFISELNRVNNYITQGNGPELSEFPWWAQLLIRRRGVAHLFGGTSPEAMRITASKTGTVRRGFRWKVNKGQYDVRIERTSPTVDPDDFPGVREDCYWSVLRSVHYQKPINRDVLPPISQIAMRVKAGEQFNGNLNNVNCIATSILPIATPNGSGGYDWELAPTRNNAWCFVDSLAGDYRPRPITLDEIDMVSVYQWSVDCATEEFKEAEHPTIVGRRFDLVTTKATTADKMARTICSAGNASFNCRAGIYGVTQDKLQTVPVAHFAATNSWGFQAEKSHIAQPDALRVSFIDENSDYVQSERIVYADGFDETNAQTFESITLPGVTNTRQAWADARYFMAVAKLRPFRYSFYCDLAWKTIARGALIRMNNEVPLWGQGSGRILSSIHADGTTTLTLDNRVIIKAEQAYSLVAIYSDGWGYLVELDIYEEDISTNVLTFTGQWPVSPETDTSPGGVTIEGGEQFMLGTVGHVTRDLVVVSIESNSKKQAKIICVDSAPGVHRDPNLPIPPYDLNLDIPPILETPRPAPPEIRIYPSEHPKAGEQMILSDEQVLLLGRDGTLYPRIVVYLNPNTVSAGNSEPVSIQKQIRRVPDSESSGGADTINPWLSTSSVPATDAELSFEGVEELRKYDIRFRNVDKNGLASEWTTVYEHTVIGKTTRPKDITNLFMDSGAILRWVYYDAPKDFSHFEVRYFPTVASIPPWEDTLLLGRTSSTQYPVGTFSNDSATFFVKAFDTSGNESENAAVLIQNIIPGAPRNVIVTKSYEPTWDDPDIVSIVGEVIDGKLMALHSDDDLFWTGSDDDLFWTGSDDDLFWNYAWDPPVVYWLYEAPENTGGSELFLKWEIENSDGVNAYYCKNISPLEFDFERDALAMPNRIIVEEGSTYIFIVALMDVEPGSARPGLSELSVNIDVPDIVERFNDLTISSGDPASGIRLPIQRTYNKIVGVGGLTIQDTGTGAVTLEVVDKGYPSATNPTDGPLIKCKDASGTYVGVVFDAETWGY